MTTINPPADRVATPFAPSAIKTPKSAIADDMAMIRAASELTRDLVTPSPRIYWTDFLASTSIGQEGLDFHWYCSEVVHWNLPSNPIDLEQREGRVNRYQSLVVRRRVVQAVAGPETPSTSWKHLFDWWGQLLPETGAAAPEEAVRRGHQVAGVVIGHKGALVDPALVRG